jgi:hypothetical protein
VVLKPQHGLYKDICKLLNSAPLLQLSDIPTFNNFFQSAEFDGNGSADRKRWIVKVGMVTICGILSRMLSYY